MSVLVPVTPGSQQPTETDGPLIPPTRAGIEQVLIDEGMTLGYKPTLPYQTIGASLAEIPPYYIVMRDVEAMSHHPHVKNCLRHYCNGIWPAEFEIKASNSAVADYVHRMLKRWWQRGLRETQWHAYRWGWVGGELSYTIENNELVFDSMVTFSPRDATILTWRNQYIGVRVRSGRAMSDAEDTVVDLWGPAKGRPSKAMWFIHNRRYGNWHGWTQFYGAWKPWRRLAYPNGGEESLDGGMYRFNYGGILVRHPKGSDQASRQPPGNQRQDFRDKAIEMANGLKAGGNVAMSSEMNEHGKYVWDLEPIKYDFNPTNSLDYIKYLKDEIAAGIGTPTEIMEPGAGGAGYSGADIRKESFFVGQQYNAEAQVFFVRTHFLDALVEWMFGPDKWYDVQVKPLLQSQQVQATGMNNMPGSPGAQGGAPAAPGDAGQGMDQGQEGFDITKLYESGPGGESDQGDMQNMGLEVQEQTNRGTVARRAPAGGIMIAGKFYNGGEFIPSAAMAEASDEELDALDEAEASESYYDGDEDKGDEHQAPKQAAMESGQKEYGVVLLDLTDGDNAEALDIVASMGDAVRPEDLGEKGVEQEPHITVLFGLKGVNQLTVQEALQGHGPITVTLGETDIFENEEGDVAYIAVESPELIELHNDLASKLPNESGHDEYVPHLTVAYLKSGSGEAYRGAVYAAGQTITFNRVVFSDENDKRTHLNLGDDHAAEPADE